MRYQITPSATAMELSERLVVIGKAAVNVASRFYITASSGAMLVWEYVFSFIFSKDGFGIQTKDGYIIKCKDQ